MEHGNEKLRFEPYTEFSKTGTRNPGPMIFVLDRNYRGQYVPDVFFFLFFIITRQMLLIILQV